MLFAAFARRGHRAISARSWQHHRFATAAGAHTGTVRYVSDKFGFIDTDERHVADGAQADFFFHVDRAPARRDSAEGFCRLNAPSCTARDWIFIPVYCFAIS